LRDECSIDENNHEAHEERQVYRSQDDLSLTGFVPFVLSVVNVLFMTKQPQRTRRTRGLERNTIKHGRIPL
ncbi:MAG: hypothetical protein PVH09_02340, partial [Chromatiales bacterium]